MSVTNGQDANQTNFNNAFMSRTANTTAAGTITQSNTTQSSSKDTGAIVTEGGIGVEKNAYIGGNADVAGTGHIAGALTIDDKLNIAIENNAATGTDQTLSLPKFLVRLTAGLTSVVGITAPSSSQPILIANDTGGSVTIKNDTTATAANRIITGTGSDLILISGASLLLVYDLTETRWRVVGATAAVAASGIAYSKVTTSGNYTALTSVDGIVYTGSGGHTITLYAASAQTNALDILNLGTGNVTIARAGSDTILDETSQILFPNAGVRLISDGSSKFGSV